MLSSISLANDCHLLGWVFQNNLGPHLPKRSDGSLSITAMLVCGSVAGLTAQTLTFPTDTVRHRMQANGVGGSVRTVA